MLVCLLSMKYDIYQHKNDLILNVLVCDAGAFPASMETDIPWAILDIQAFHWLATSDN